MERTRRRRPVRLIRALAVIGVLSLLVAACAEDDAATTTVAPTTSTTSGGTSGVNLAGVCPDPVVMQMDWEPESEHGGLY